MSTSNDSSEDYFVIGDAPRPTTGAALDVAVRAILARAAEQSTEVTGLASISVASTLDGPDIALVTLDLTGVRVNVSDSGAVPTVSDEQLGRVISREDGVVREFRISANPLSIQGVDVVVDGSVESVKFVWAVDEHSRLGIGGSEKQADRVHIQLHAEADQQAIVAAATALLQQQLSDAGVTVSDVEVELVSSGPRSAHVRIDAKVRKGILGASASFDAMASIDEKMVLTVIDPVLSSRNPIVAALLLTVRERITAAVAAPVDLNASLPAWLHLHTVAFDFGDRVSVDLTFR